jgi:hypothetical protein
MATVAVEVDDAINGNLPAVCVRTGRPTDMWLNLDSYLGEPRGVLVVLLILAGPLGWIAYAVMAARSERLLVRLPYTREALRYDRRLLWARRIAVAVGMVALALSAFEVQGTRLLLWLAFTSGVTWAMLTVVIRALSVDVGLDATRRRAVLDHVHPDFVRALRQSQPAAAPPQPQPLG